MNRLSPFIGFLEQQKAAIFFGAGISKIAGCAGLRDIYENLLKINSVQEKITSQKIEVVPRELILFCKSICKKSEQDRREYEGIMRKSLTYSLDKFNREYLPFIKKLKQITPFPSIMTTNVDDCLTKTEQFDVAKIYHRISDMRLDLFRSIGIFHIHGYMEDVGGQLWDLLEYPARYEDRDFKNFVINVFKEHSILFLGYSFQDDQELKELMAKAKRESLEPKMHFALLPADEPHPHVDEAMYVENFNIQIIRYGSKADFVMRVCEWIDSNFNPTSIGKDEDVSHMFPMSDGVS